MNERKQTGSTDLLVDHLTNKQQKVHRRSYGRGQKLQALKNPLYKDFHLSRKTWCREHCRFSWRPIWRRDGICSVCYLNGIIGPPTIISMLWVFGIWGVPRRINFFLLQCSGALHNIEGNHTWSETTGVSHFYESAWFLFVFIGL